jgi:hypothetical protein
MTEDTGAAFGTGSREPSPAVSAASGFDPSREAILAAIRHTEYKYFGDYEMSEAQIDAVYLLVDCARALNRVHDALARRSIPTMDPVWSAAFNAALDMVGRAIRDSDEHPKGDDAQNLGAGPAASKPCSMGVGCDEYGVCYASAHGRPEMCPRDRDRSGAADETRDAAQPEARARARQGIAQDLTTFKDEEGYTMEEYLSPSDIQKLSRIIAARIEGRG